MSAVPAGHWPQTCAFSLPSSPAAITVFVITTSGAFAQSVRDHTRLTPNGSTAVTESQANELTLTLTEAAVRPIQIWVRTAGVVDVTRRTVAAYVPSAEGAFVKVGQRVRAFSLESRSSMYQARVSRIEHGADGVMVSATLAGPGHQGSVRYILEIVTERGEFLSVPNEAIIETDGKQVVYVQEQQGRYVPREIQLGVQGELYTQVLSGLKPGEQVVTFGSFFIDAEHKLKGLVASRARMITAIIEHVIRFRWIVWCLVAVLIALSAYALRTAALDAIPDISDPQVIVYTKWPRSPQVIETEVTEPIIRALAGSPDIQSIRGTSHMGYSFIYVILTDPGRRAAVRQFVTDRLNAIRSQLPADANVTIGPNASSMGWIYQYALVDREGTHDLRELRLLNESQIEPALQSTPGIAEVASVGGLEKQYQVKLFPPLLSERGISLRQVLASVQGAFQETGGRTIEITNREYQLRGSVNTENLDKLEFLVLGRDKSGQPVHLKDVGYLQVGYDLRRGIADLDGTGEVVGGIAIMEQGRNVLAVTRALQQRLEQLKTSLPEGVEVVTTYDRSSLIWDTLTNFFQAIVYELIVVILVIAVALRNVRAAVAPVCVLLFGTLFTALPLSAFDQTINLFALAGLAIAIGEMADATIVIVENCTAELARRGNLSAAERMETIIRATATMTRPLLFSMLIIVTSFLPIFFLGEREGRLFNPLAFSKTFAMAFSTLLTLFLLPAVIVWVFKRGVSAPADVRERAPSSAAIARALTRTIRHRYAFVGVSTALLLVAAVVLTGFQKDYMPEMEEGSILYMPTTLPGLPSREAGWILQQMDRKLKAFPEVERVFGKLGRADTATDPAPVEMIETTVMLKPRSEWRAGHDQGQARRRDEPGDADRRLRQQLDTADQHARDDAGHRDPDAGRDQGEGEGAGGRRGDRAEHRGAAQAIPRDAGGDRRAHLAGLFRGCAARSRAHGASTA